MPSNISPTLRRAIAMTMATPLFLMAGCSLPHVTDMSEGTVITTSTISLPLYLAGTEYDRFNEVMENANGGPAVVTCDESTGRHAETDDMRVVARLWNKLRNIEVKAGVEYPDDQVGDSGPVYALRFVWQDGSEYSFAFKSTGWFYGKPGACVEIANPDATREIIDMTADNFGRGADAPAIAIPQPRYEENPETQALYGDDWEYEGEKLTTLASVNNLWLWDLDGDGEGDPVGFTFQDNGDREPSNLIVTCYKPGINDGWMRGAYEILGVKGGHDDRGSFLCVTYKKGDFYFHERTARCLVRLGDGAVIVEEL